GEPLRAHPPAAAVGFVADAEEVDLPRLVASVAPALLGERRIGRRGDVLDPLHRLARRTGADEIGRAACRGGAWVSEAALIQAEDGIRDFHVTGVQTCALPISANHSARIRPPQPLGSLPMPRKSIFHGSSRPLRRRSWASVELVGEVMYSTHCIASRGVPVPTLTLRKVLAPTSSANSKNSWVPKALCSSLLPHQRLSVTGRDSRGPMPVRQS